MSVLSKYSNGLSMKDNLEIITECVLAELGITECSSIEHVLNDLSKYEVDDNQTMLLTAIVTLGESVDLIDVAVNLIHQPEREARALKKLEKEKIKNFKPDDKPPICRR